MQADKMILMQILKALSDETRLRILNLLWHEELCVCELEMLLDINQSNTSRHLSRLTNAQIISSKKRAQYVYYKINENTLKEYGFIKEILDNELIKLKIYKEDLEALDKYRKSGFSCDDFKGWRNIFQK